MVMRSLILSRLDYANALYFGLPDYQFKKLQVLQNAAARALIGTPKRCSMKLLLRDLCWLPVAQRVTFKAFTLAHSALNGVGPLYLRKRFSFYVPRRHLRSSSQCLAAIPRFRRARMGGSSLSVKAAEAWNSLSFELRSIRDPALLKKTKKKLCSLFNW